MTRPTFIAELLKATGKPDEIAALARYIEELEAGRDAARNEALEEAAKIAEEFETLWWNKYKAGLKASMHLEGKTDGASEICTAMRALKSKENEHE